MMMPYGLTLILLLFTLSDTTLLGIKYDPIPRCAREIMADHTSPNYNSTFNNDCAEFISNSFQELKKLLNFTDDQINFIKSLDREAMSLLYGSERTKRQTGLHVRRECRTLSQNDWGRLAQAIRRLKFDPGNEYDTMAHTHTLPAVIDNSHDGSNILGWHRLFLFLFEIALRRKVGGVVLCYWDSSLDYLLRGRGQVQSAAFSHELFGNARGQVTTGPFANFPTPWGPLRRNFGGEGGSLVRPHIVDMIERDPNIRRDGQLVDGDGATGFTDPLSGERTSLEAEHNNAHVAVGALMAIIPNAAYDPLFFFHHCYIDYVWELFRRKQMRLGIDPTRDYGGHGGPAHARNAPMRGLIPGWRNIHGYSNFFSRRYRYAYHPVCGNGCSGSERFLYCPRGRRFRRCIPRTMEGRARPPQRIVGRSRGARDITFSTNYDDNTIAH